ncbi:unnamed protein product [Protopolystoma xenopodis]|uniref:Secreted protein n=1 Tax=Protopolystoma xenopodis TaxID=117903 RepID=A0A3S5AGP3_9PLAT|nr:unnamed protein product [Protopolystoma xenopodis]
MFAEANKGLAYLLAIFAFQAGPICSLQDDGPKLARSSGRLVVNARLTRQRTEKCAFILGSSKLSRFVGRASLGQSGK